MKTLLDEIAMAVLPATAARYDIETVSGVDCAVEAAYHIAARAMEVRKAYVPAGHIDPEFERQAQRLRMRAGLQLGPRNRDENT
jgi:hypothetical protein